MESNDLLLIEQSNYYHDIKKRLLLDMCDDFKLDKNQLYELIVNKNYDIFKYIDDDTFFNCLIKYEFKCNDILLEQFIIYRYTYSDYKISEKFKYLYENISCINKDPYYRCTVNNINPDHKYCIKYLSTTTNKCKICSNMKNAIDNHHIWCINYFHSIGENIVNFGKFDYLYIDKYECFKHPLIYATIDDKRNIDIVKYLKKLYPDRIKISNFAEYIIANLEEEYRNIHYIPPLHQYMLFNDDNDIYKYPVMIIGNDDIVYDKLMDIIYDYRQSQNI